jgi:hypothetical protein
MVNVPAGMETLWMEMGEEIFIVHEAVLLPSLVVTVMVAAPAAMAVTKPELLTEVLLASLVLQVMLLLLELDGVIVAVSCTVPPMVKFAEVLSSETPVRVIIAASSFLQELNITARIFNSVMVTRIKVTFFIGVEVCCEFKPFYLVAKIEIVTKSCLTIVLCFSS